MEEHDATNVGDRGSSPLWDILSFRSLMDRHGTSNAVNTGSSPVGSIASIKEVIKDTNNELMNKLFHMSLLETVYRVVIWIWLILNLEYE